MFNLSGTELVFLVVIALVVLGPEKLPDAVRKFARMYGELKKVTTGFQSELRSALDEPMKEMRATADTLRDAVNIDVKGQVDSMLKSGDAKLGDATSGAAKSGAATPAAAQPAEVRPADTTASSGTPSGGDGSGESASA